MFGRQGEGEGGGKAEIARKLGNFPRARRDFSRVFACPLDISFAETLKI